MEGALFSLRVFFSPRYSYKINFRIQEEIFFWENHLLCLPNSQSCWLPFGILKLNSGSVRLLCLSPRRIFRIENPWLFAHLLNTLGLRRTQAARKSNIKYLIMQRSMTIRVCMSSNPKRWAKRPTRLK